MNAAEPARQSDHRGIPAGNPTTNDEPGRAVQHEVVETSGAQQLLFHRGGGSREPQFAGCPRNRRAVNMSPGNSMELMIPSVGSREVQVKSLLGREGVRPRRPGARSAPGLRPATHRNQPHRFHETGLTAWRAGRGVQTNSPSVRSMSRFQSVRGAESKAKRSPWSKMYQLPRVTSFCNWGIIQPQYPR